MFDNPSKNLQRLQEELLAAEEPQQEIELDEDPDQAYQDVKQILARDEWNETQRDPLYFNYIPEEPIFEEEEEVPQPQEKQKKGSNLSIILMLILESILLGGLAAVWWSRWR